ncbi:Uncharacterized protein PBTT_03014 [Plasmodiophora brassicae]|uniref:Uncharacterized protein n=1 Tax=Plasmodiophora brassicae TaxID=37360 RepID=A0A3P3Y5T7_PLABS|nr:unnamed protein product [Plasmodiophora brassicae]
MGDPEESIFRLNVSEIDRKVPTKACPSTPAPLTRTMDMGPAPSPSLAVSQSPLVMLSPPPVPVRVRGLPSPTPPKQPPPKSVPRPKSIVRPRVGIPSALSQHADENKPSSNFISRLEADQKPASAAASTSQQQSWSPVHARTLRQDSDWIKQAKN